MPTEAWQLEYYETADGKCPVREYLDRLSARDAASVTFDLDLLEEFGTSLGRPYTRHLQGKIWELRTRAGRQHRILYFATSGRRLVLLHAFTKKTQKTPPQEIETAQRRLEDFERRRQ